MAFVGMVMGVCPPAATLLGGHLHVSVGWRANFVVMTVLALLLIFAAWRWLRRGRSGTSGGVPMRWRPWRRS